ncbi:IucA/IucC family siderophore biosynthesis protein [Chitinophaga agrisoli]|uniref:IucA/IucC family siderophore biosynthesis protein n=1 Tax=Chitinophaga agrisoli TaxID=2607653 RepID=A0A5B2W5U3_9BACT|nr:IucA/IucC family siderophore biosynthesis protein [Chitinophaga agrisoli]KAA2245747.1 IucA/IucC family siderophore biosynthesis protein [Chitinophaga agrisoli]
MFNPVSPRDAVAHLQPDIWASVNRLHIRKMIAEYAHEQIIQPSYRHVKEGWVCYVLKPDLPDIEYRFRARVLRLHHWYILTESIEKLVNGQPVPLDALAFIVEFSEQLNMDPALLPVYMEEVAATLYGSAYMHAQGGPSSAQLAAAGYQEIEHAMTGHPRFIANNGRVGFDAADYRSFAPEAAEPFALLWLAGHRQCTEFTSIAPLDYASVLQQELGDTADAFNAMLEAKGLNPADYIFMPVHPWQWYNKLAGIFAPDIAAQRLVLLGYGQDQYLPQQSIRTFFNIDQPQKYYVKTALSILNMGYVRGLSPYFMRTTPVINEWVYNVVEQDPYLQETGFCTLREIATTGYANHYYETATKTDNPYKKMLASLWRESPLSKIKQGQRLATMAALLHVDPQGIALLPEFIRLSGLDAEQWLRQYIHCYMSPLLHCFYQYDMVFMPHGENIILVLENHVPVRAIMKDIGEEVSVINTDAALPEAAARLHVTVPDNVKTLPLFTQIFDGIFRFIAAILVEHMDFQEQRFWELVANVVQEYQQRHPQLAHKFLQYDLFVPEISPDALNRLQISNNRQLRNRANPFDVPSVGKLDNPIAAFKTSAYAKLALVNE